MHLHARVARAVSLAAVALIAGASIATASVVAVSSAPAVAATTVVHIGSGFTFSPAAITVHVGDTVTWQHDGSSTMHSVTADDGSFDSGPNCPPTCLGANATFSHTFTTAGAFRYYCKIHGGPGGIGMSGTVTVLASTPSTTTSPAPSTTVPAGTVGTQGTGAAPGVSPTPGASAAPAAAPSASLPRTGSDTVPLLLAGAAALLLGGFALALSRRRVHPMR